MSTKINRTKMKKSQLKQIIREEIKRTLRETETINEDDYNSFLNDISIKISELPPEEQKPFLETIKKFVEGKLSELMP